MALLAECAREALGPHLAQYVIPPPGPDADPDAGPDLASLHPTASSYIPAPSKDGLTPVNARYAEGRAAPPTTAAPADSEATSAAMVAGVRLTPQGERRLFRVTDKLYAQFDANKDDLISENELKLTQLQLIRSYSMIKRRIKENSSLMATLHRVLGALAWIGNFIIILWICKVDVYRAWISITSVILSLSFAFSSSIRQLYEATVFVFYLHPFDTEDAVEIDTNYYRVMRIQLLSTEFMTTSGERVIYPNSILASKVILNHSRSDPWFDGFEVHVNLDMPRSTVAELEARVKAMTLTMPHLFNGVVVCRMRLAPLDLQKIKLACYYGLAFPRTENGKCSNARNEVFFTAMAFLTEKGVRLAHRQEVFIKELPLQMQMQQNGGGGAPPPQAADGAGPLGALNALMMRAVEPIAAAAPAAAVGGSSSAADFNGSFGGFYPVGVGAQGVATGAQLPGAGAEAEIRKRPSRSAATGRSDQGTGTGNTKTAL